MNKKVVLITGTSTGLGLETSLLLASKGYRVYATMRDLNKQTMLADGIKKQNLDICIKELDVTKQDTINNCVNDIVDAEGHIDILINNAGAGFIKTTEHASEEEMLWQFNVNLMGTIRCTKAVLPIMREHKHGHVINITSVGGLVGQPFNELYCAAKFGVEGYTESMASYIQPNFNIHFTAIEPGGIRSEFANNVLDQFQTNGGMKDDPYKPILESYIASAQQRAESGVYQTSEEVADVILACVEMEQPPIRMRTSQWGEAFTKYKTSADPTGLLSRDAVSFSLK